MTISSSSDTLAQGLSIEMQVLIGGLRGLPPPQDTPLDWVKLGHLAVAHGVAPLLHRAWSSLPDGVPGALLTDLASIRWQTLKQSLLALRQRDTILHILGEAQIPVLTLKGAALARHWYRDLSLRPFGDIDLLIPASEAGTARRALFAAGYQSDRHPAGLNIFAPHHGAPLLHPGMPCAIELHSQLQALTPLQNVRYEEFCARSIILDGRDALVRTLGPEDTLLYLCAHLLRHVVDELGWRLLSAWDIARHLERYSIDWVAFTYRARLAGLQTACRATLGLAALLADARVPESQMDANAAQRLVPLPVGRVSMDHYAVFHATETLLRGDLRGAWQGLVTVMTILRLHTTLPAGEEETRSAGQLWSTLLTSARSLVEGTTWLVTAAVKESGWLVRAMSSDRRQIREGIERVRRARAAKRAVFDLLPEGRTASDDVVVTYVR